MGTTFAKLTGAIVLAMALLVGQSVVANAATVVAQINGGGTAVMTDDMGVTTFSIHATLFSGGRATGRIDCVDRVGSAPNYPGNIYGAIVGWTGTLDGQITLYVDDGRLIGIPGGPIVSGGLPFEVTIQKFGGAGVGRWTLSVPAFQSTPICFELLTSGQIAIRRR